GPANAARTTPVRWRTRWGRKASLRCGNITFIAAPTASCSRRRRRRSACSPIPRYVSSPTTHLTRYCRISEFCSAVLPQQYRLGAVQCLGAVGHGFFQRSSLHRNVLGKESCQRDIALRIAASLATRARGERFAGKHAATERRSEQPKVGRRAGESIVRRG